MKYCLTKEQTIKAWNLEKSGMSRTAVAMKFYVSEKTLQRSYNKYYKLGCPKRKNGIKK